MKYLVLIFLLSSCVSERDKKITESKELSKDSDLYYKHVSEYTYEGCEYIVVDHGPSRWGSHKGNCKNPEHKFK